MRSLSQDQVSELRNLLQQLFQGLQIPAVDDESREA
jgi:hypothetical protein